MVSFRTCSGRTVLGSGAEVNRRYCFSSEVLVPLMGSKETSSSSPPPPPAVDEEEDADAAAANLREKAE